MKIFLSASQLSRKIGIPQSRILRAISRRVVEPTGQLPDCGTFVFEESRAAEILDRLNTTNRVQL